MRNKPDHISFYNWGVTVQTYKGTDEDELKIFGFSPVAYSLMEDIGITHLLQFCNWE